MLSKEYFFSRAEFKENLLKKIKLQNLQSFHLKYRQRSHELKVNDEIVTEEDKDLAQHKTEDYREAKMNGETRILYYL